MPFKNKARTYILVSLFFFALHASSAQGQWYEIVHVDLQAQDAVAAKEQATAQAEKNASERFFSRVAPDILKSPEQLDDISSRCYAGMDILSEKTSGVRYIAKIQQNFNRSCVLGYLKTHAIHIKNKPLDDVSSPAEAVNPTEIYQTSQDLDPPPPSKPLLLVSVVHAGEKTSNPWEDKLELPSIVAQKLNNNNDYLIPLGDLNDQISLPSIDLDHMNHETFEKILGTYETTDGILALITLKSQGEPNSLTTIETIRISAKSLRRCLVKEASKMPPPEADAGDLLGQTASLVAEAVGQSVRSCHGADTPQHTEPSQGPIRVLVTVSDFTKWLKIKKDLLSLNDILKITMREMASHHVSFDMHFNNTLENLHTHLGYIGLIMSHVSGQDTYQISEAETEQRAAKNDG